MELRGNQRENLHKALVDAIQSERELERLMLHGMNVRLWNVVTRGTREDIIFDLLSWIEAQGRLEEFIKVLRQSRPYHTPLRIVLDEIENVHTPEPPHRDENQTGHDWFRRRPVIFSSMLVVAVLLLSGVLLWNRENQQKDSNVNAPAPSPVTNQSPIVNTSSTPVPTASRNPPRATSSPDKSPETKPNQVARHIAVARSLYASRRYQSALRECDRALRLDPNNREALELKKRIQKTIDILNRN